jgi:hypothetical protein
VIIDFEANTARLVNEEEEKDVFDAELEVVEMELNEFN